MKREITVEIINESGYEAALYGLGLSFGLSSYKSPKALFKNEKEFDKPLFDRISGVAERLAGKGNGHDKFLRQIALWVVIDAPLYLWKQIDTYKIGTVTSSESTMHTLMNKPITKEMFYKNDVDSDTIKKLENLRLNGDFTKLNRRLPQSYMQKRTISMNYEVVNNIIKQRKAHKLDEEWDEIVKTFKTMTEHPELIK